jgi:hypothetical protein
MEVDYYNQLFVSFKNNDFIRFYFDIFSYAVGLYEFCEALNITPSYLTELTNLELHRFLETWNILVFLVRPTLCFLH